MADKKESKKTGSENADRADKKMEKQATPNIKPGMTVKVHQRITEKGPKGDKQRVQIFEGIIISHRHGNQAGSTITVRKISEGIGVEKIFPLNSPNVLKVEPVKQAKVRQSKLYYIRDSKKRLKEGRIEVK